MMCLALAGKCGGLGESGFSNSIARAGGAPKSEASPNTPIPRPDCTSISRRVQNAPSVCAARFARNRSIMDAILSSIDKHKFVGNQQGLCQLFPRGKTRRRRSAEVVRRVPQLNDAGGRACVLFRFDHWCPAESVAVVRLPAIDDKIEHFPGSHRERVEGSRTLLVLDGPFLKNSLPAGNDPAADSVPMLGRMLERAANVDFARDRRNPAA